MLNVVLFQPEIPPNTGNIIRLCANTGMRLHLLRPLGFELDDRRLRRAGLDYAEYARVCVHDGLDDFLAGTAHGRLFAFSTRGRQRFDAPAYRPGDSLLFGPETRGLPTAVLERPELDGVLRLPMQAGSRSLNLSNSVAVAVFEAWRQLGYAGAAPPGG